jgi:signal transduction histidine kinase
MDIPKTDVDALVAALDRVAAALRDAAIPRLPGIVAVLRAVDPAQIQGVHLYLPADGGPAPRAEGGLVWAAGDPAPPLPAVVPPEVLAAYRQGADGPPDTETAALRDGEAARLVLPLPGSAGWTGVLVLQLAAPPSGPRRAAYHVLAHLLGSALENAQLRRAALRDAALDRLLEQITAEVTSTLSLSEILQHILTHLADAIPFSGGSIALITPDHELEIVVAVGEIDVVARRVRVPVGQGISGWVAEHGQPYLSNDLDQEAGVRPVGRDIGTNRLIRSYMAVPLLVEERVIGILQVNSPDQGAYTADDLALLAQVALRCANAVAQARLFTELNARAERLAILNAIGRRISSQLNLDELFLTCYEQVRRVMPVDAFFAALCNSERGTLSFEFRAEGGEIYPKSEAPLGLGLTGYVIRTATPLVAGSRAEWPAEVTPVIAGADHLAESLMIVPLIFEQEVLGALSAQSYEAHAYTDQDVRLFGTLANQMAVAIRNAELYQSERAAQQAKTEFLSLISHELKTPLTSIKGTAQVVTRRMLKAFSAGQVTEPDAVQARQQDLRALALITSQVDRLTRLVDDLLDVSRLQSGSFELYPTEADLAQVAHGVVESLRPTSADHQLLFEAPPLLPGVFDPLRVEQVLTNLLSNAVKYTPAGTSIRVRVTLEGDHALVCVADQGPGLPPDEQERIFDRYFRTDVARRSPRSGVGLGLYISRQLIERHGGTIWVESTPGAGATFCFRLPLDGAVALLHRHTPPDDSAPE